MRSTNSPCDPVRLALSARLDDEPMTLPTGTVDRHLRGCPTCRAWLDGAERVTRAVRVRPVAVPDLTARILAAVHAEGGLVGAGPVGAGLIAGKVGAGRRRLAGVVDWASRIRWALGLLTVVQLMIAVFGLLGAAGHDAHAGREVAALDIALSVGLLVVACYPEYARVFKPVAVALVVCFAAISALDMIEGLVSPARVAVHLVTLAQAGLVWLLASGPSQRRLPTGRSRDAEAGPTRVQPLASA